MYATLESLIEQPAVLDALAGGAQALLILLVGLPLARFASVAVVRAATRFAPPTRLVLIRRAVFYSLAALVLASALRELGFDLSVLVGAAGILTVAVGFASQTSASNVISGLFLMVEQPFVIGDAVRMGETTGEVIAIDLLSVKLRTFDNLFVRVPNETVMKAQITNMTRFPIRRIELVVGIAYASSLDAAREALLKVADKHRSILIEPEPVVQVRAFGDSGVELMLAAWTVKEGFVNTRSDLTIQVKAELDAQGIEIPYPQRSLHAGSGSAPLPVRLVTTAAD